MKNKTDRLGLNMYEWAEVWTYVGIESAINLDGGGSSVSVYNDKVISKPTCHDNSEICERAVANIVCLND